MAFRIFFQLSCLAFFYLLSGCYSFKGVSSISTNIKTIHIDNFSNHTSQISESLTSKFYNSLQDLFHNRARLTYVETDADLNIEGEFTDYTSEPINLSSDGSSQNSRVVISIRFRYRKENNPPVDKSFTDKATELAAGETLFDAERYEDEIASRLALQVFNDIANDW